MSLFKPNSAWAVIGVMLFLIALYLVLEHGSAASSVLGTLFNGTTLLTGTLQGRNVTGGGNVSVGK